MHQVLSWYAVFLGKDTIHILDTSCGDFVWMSRFLQTRSDVYYTGIDTVPDLIKHHQNKFGGYSRWRFLEADFLDDSFTFDRAYDLILSRMTLQHLFFDEVLAFLAKMSKSTASFALLTTFPAQSKNLELKLTEENPGRFRFLNLELPPIALTPPVCMERDGPVDAYQGWDHFVGLWRLPLRQVKYCDDSYSWRMKQTPVVVHSCTLSIPVF